MIWMMLLAAQAGDDAQGLIGRSRDVIVGERCVADPNTTDITVCGRRRADRFRVPFIVHDAGDPRYEAVIVERDRLLHRTNPVEELSPFKVGGGMAGVTMNSRHGLTGATDRPLAP
ncbi:hypothetical protein DC429_11205 [Arthrobacter sp. TPD3018]|jgi:hypothetical protein|uniref:hypothetical protein n=1 Tax=Bacteria TaxID=2 RepID=UPI000D523C6D|nr:MULTISPECIES: hypothetical protein [Bacteria]PVE55887.1 hypothetical protein DC425_11195 [Sphingomonas sp. TPD3009]PVE57629.1 hypothetical protein DC429_11205 [Arthrobacter sp. TPD3018]PVE83253.1 hypothetical protein DC431_11195 [Sphingomonas melonis]RTL14400.1 MAG: hypothetical protein EKK50_15765 [Sphingomonadaceae bacterium]